MTEGSPPRIGSVAWDEGLPAAGTSRAELDAALLRALKAARDLGPGGGWDEHGEELPAPDLSGLGRIDEHALHLSGESLLTTVAGHWLMVELRRSSASLLSLWSACMQAVEADPRAYRFWIDQLASFLVHGDERDAGIVRQFLAANVFFSRRPVSQIEPLGEMLARVPRRAWSPILEAAWELDWRVKEPWLSQASVERELHGAIASVIESALTKGEIDRVEARDRLVVLDVRDPPRRARVRELLASLA